MARARVTSISTRGPAHDAGVRSFAAQPGLAFDLHHGRATPPLDRQRTARARSGATRRWPHPMTAESLNRVRVFLCHSSADKPEVQALYRRLTDDGFVPWLDETDLLSGEHWELGIQEAVRAADYFVVCLSNAAITRAGYVHKEIKLALDVADRRPEGSIYVIPVRLEDCPMPERLSHLHRVDLFAENGYDRLTRTLSKATSPPPHPELDGVSEQVGERLAERLAPKPPLMTKAEQTPSPPQAVERKRPGVRAVIGAGVAVVAVVVGLVALPGGAPSTPAAKKCGSRLGDPARGIYCVNNPCESYPDTCTLPVYSSPGGSAVVDRLQDDEEIRIECQVRGARFQGHDRATYIWDRLDDGHYISDYFASTAEVGAFDPRLPRC